MAENIRATCSPTDPCFLTKKNRDVIIQLTCQARELIHQLQCSSTRAKGDNAAACFSAQEVSAQEMGGVAEDLEHAGRQLQEELRKHLDLHEVLGLRRNRGRARLTDRDSGVVSWTPENGLPVQEETTEREVTSSVLGATQESGAAATSGTGNAIDDNAF